MKIYKFFKHEIIFFVFLGLFLVLTLFFPQNIHKYFYYIHWETITALAGLLIITTAIKESGFIDKFAVNLLKKVDNEKKLSIYLVLLSAILSSFLTNDISLFIIVPITLSLQKFLKNNILKLIIFEALAVNVGSTLTPIGNPQNIYLWHKWDISFFNFIIKMFPAFFIQLLVLIIFVIAIFKNKKLALLNENHISKINKKFFIISILMFILFIYAIEVGLLYYIIVLIFIVYFILDLKIIKKVDWILLILFIIIFIDFNIIGNFNLISKIIDYIELKNSQKIFIFSALISQIISNVPASVFISKYSSDWFAISYGVNIGGNGIFIASLANIIALRMAKNKKIWFEFHKYSIPFFITNLFLTYLFLNF